MLFASHAATILGCAALLVALRLRGWDSAEFFRAFESRDHFILWANVFGIFMAPTYFVMAWLLRNRCREVNTIQRSLEGFRMADTQCYDPNDRKLVEARIAEVWGKAEAFDRFVQEKVAREMSATIGAADLPPMWLDVGMCWPWIPFFTYAGLIQTSEEWGVWQYTTSTIGSITFMWPLFIMFWNFFAFKIYELFDEERPNLTVFLIGIWSIANCLFGACVDREFLYFAYGRPLWQCVALLALYWGGNTAATYYFTHVEKRAHKGEFTWASKAVVASYWLVTAFSFNLCPAVIGCEHWLCIWPHPPLS